RASAAQPWRAGRADASGSQLPGGGGPGSSWPRGGDPPQPWPGGHCALLAQAEAPAPWTVTSKTTGAPADAACAITCHGPSAAAVVTRKARASPPGPVRSAIARPELALQRELATSGSVKVTTSPGTGS